VTSLRQALEARPNAAELHSLLGATLLVQRNFAEARTELGRALELDAGLLEAKRYLAQAHYNLGEWDFAVDVGHQYLAERPADAQVRMLVAQSLVRLNRMPEARKELDQIPDENRNGEVYYAFGRVAQARKDLAEARKYLLMADKDMPDNSEILTALLQLDVQEKRVAESKARIDEAVQHKPDDAKLRQLQGVVAAIDGRDNDAEAAFKKAIELDPLDVSSYERLGRFYSARGKLDETTKVYEQALELNPDKAILHHYLGVLYELAGDRDRAIQRYEDAVRLGPDLAEAKNNLAFLYADSGKNLDRALELAQDAKQRLPDSPSVADTLGWVLYKRGVPVAAVGYLKEAESRTDANDASLGVVRYHVALAYEAAGEPDKALAAVDRSLAAVQAQTEAASKRGGNPAPEPAWVKDARVMRDRLQKAQSAGG
jgi:tetratricopeptide (TPR) repeat protein